MRNELDAWEASIERKAKMLEKVFAEGMRANEAGALSLIPARRSMSWSPGNRSGRVAAAAISEAGERARTDLCLTLHRLGGRNAVSQGPLQAADDAATLVDDAPVRAGHRACAPLTPEILLGSVLPARRLPRRSRRPHHRGHGAGVWLYRPDPRSGASGLWRGGAYPRTGMLKLGASPHSWGNRRKARADLAFSASSCRKTLQNRLSILPPTSGARRYSGGGARSSISDPRLVLF